MSAHMLRTLRMPAVCRFSSPGLVITRIPGRIFPVSAPGRSEQRRFETATATVPQSATDNARPNSRSPKRKRRASIAAAVSNDDVVVKREAENMDRFVRMMHKETEDGGGVWTRSSIMRELELENKKTEDGEGGRKGRSDAVETNLDSLRTIHQPGAKLDAEEWRALRATVGGGFTSGQLSEYIARFDYGALPPQKQEEITGWTPGTSLFLELTPRDLKRSAAQGAREWHASMAGKAELAERVLRNCWQLSVRDEIGQLDLRLSSLQIAVLLIPQRSPLRRFAHLYGVKIDVTRRLNLIRLTGTEITCVQTRDAILESLKGVKKDKVVLGKTTLISPRRAYETRSKFILWLQDTYKVHLEVEKRTFFIHALTQGDLEEARRAIIFSAFMPSEREAALTFASVPGEVKTISTRASKAMNWHDKHTKWARRAIEFHGNEMIPGGRSARRPPSQLLRSGPDSISHRLRYAMLSKGPHYQLPYTRELLVARAGKFMFQTKIKKYMKEKAQGLFVGEIPHADKFVVNLLPAAPQQPTVYRVPLIPSPKKPTAPPIVLEFVLEDSSLRLTRAIAIFWEKHQNLLLPDTSLDLRFSRYVEHDLFGGKDPANVNEQKNPVLSSIASCATMLSSAFTNRESLPVIPTISSLTIPRATLRVFTRKEGDDVGSLDAEYFLPTLQQLLTSSVQNLKFQEYDLRFSQSDLSPFLPKQVTDVSTTLLRDPPSQQDLEADKDFHSFFTSSCRMAFELGSLSRPADVDLDENSL